MIHIPQSRCWESSQLPWLSVRGDRGGAGSRSPQGGSGWALRSPASPWRAHWGSSAECTKEPGSGKKQPQQLLLCKEQENSPLLQNNNNKSCLLSTDEDGKVNFSLFQCWAQLCIQTGNPRGLERPPTLSSHTKVIPWHSRARITTRFDLYQHENISFFSIVPFQILDSSYSISISYRGNGALTLLTFLKLCVQKRNRLRDGLESHEAQGLSRFCCPTWQDRKWMLASLLSLSLSFEAPSLAPVSGQSDNTL